MKQFRFFNVGKRPYDVKLAVEHFLAGLHGPDFALKKEIKEHCLDDVVHVMGEGNLICLDIMGKVEKRLSAVPTAPETPEVCPLHPSIGRVLVR